MGCCVWVLVWVDFVVVFFEMWCLVWVMVWLCLKECGYMEVWLYDGVVVRRLFYCEFVVVGVDEDGVGVGFECL